MLTGTLDDFALPDIFRLLSQIKKTGSLDVERSAGRGTVFFRDGEVYFAESSLSRELLGQKLVRNGVITQTQLMRALDQQVEGGGRLGEVLRSAGLVFDEQLEAALRSQVEDAVFDLLRWELGEFEWHPGAETDPEVSISVSVENLIMEASRRLDELEVIRRKIPSEHSVLQMAATPPEGAAEINITPEEWRVLVLVNGARTVAEIAAEVGLDVFQAMRTLHGLVSAGLIDSPEGAEEPARAADDLDAPASEAHDLDAHEPDAHEPVAEAAVDGWDAPSFEEPQEEAPSEVVEAAEHVEPESVAEGALEEAHEPEVDAPAAEDTGAGWEREEVPEHVEAAAADGAAGESFEAPETEVGMEGSEGEHHVDPFETPVSEPEPEAEAEAEAEAGVDDEFAIDSPATDIPVTAEPSGENAGVDKSAAVRELSNLFRTGEGGDAEGPPPEGTQSETGDVEAEGAAPDPEVERRRVEDDEEITRGLISRLIDGVKGL